QFDRKGPGMPWEAPGIVVGPEEQSERFFHDVLPLSGANQGVDPGAGQKLVHIINRNLRPKVTPTWRIFSKLLRSCLPWWPVPSAQSVGTFTRRLMCRPA